MNRLNRNVKRFNGSMYYIHVYAYKIDETIEYRNSIMINKFKDAIQIKQ